MRTEWSAHWTDETKQMFDVKMKDGSFKTFQKGTWIKLPGRNDKAIIDSIVAPYNNNNNNNNNVDLGPRGITYLPWRYDEERFATMSYRMNGNQRFIICYPVGIRHYGEHIEWDLVEITSPPDNINKTLIDEVLERTNRL